MFAVPGWNITAPITTQAEPPKPKDPNKLGRKALKRKAKQELEVNAENIGEYWSKVVENEATKPAEDSQPAPKSVQGVGDEAQEKRGKKRKRGPRKKAETDDGDSKAKVEAPAAGATTQLKATEASTEKKSDGELKRDKKKRKKEDKTEQDGSAANAKPNELSQMTAPVLSLIPEPASLTPLQKSMRSKLAGARFRHLNESLYSKPSAESLNLFKDDPSMFEDYHRGFAQQVEVWPSNPVDSYVTSIVTRGKIRNRDPWKDKKRQQKGKKGTKDQDEPTPESGPGIRLTGDAKPLPRNFKGHATIADLGCGTASLSYRLQPYLKQLNLTMHSFDLSKPSGPSGPLVTVADISSLPLPSGSVDVAIFCLALMGTNWLDFIDEAYRILRWRGELWISEIKSRFGRPDHDKTHKKPPINSIGSLKKNPLDTKKLKTRRPAKTNLPPDGQQDGIADSADEAELATLVDGATAPQTNQGTDVSAFVKVLSSRGFLLDALPENPSEAINLSNKMFVKLQFVKAAAPSKGKNAKTQDYAPAADKGSLKFGLVKGKKFAAVTGGKSGDDDDDDDGDDEKVLKPCLYKIR